MTTALQIAYLRAKCVARSNAHRAAEILLAAGVALKHAVGFVLDTLRSSRVVA